MTRDVGSPARESGESLSVAGFRWAWLLGVGVVLGFAFRHRLAELLRGELPPSPEPTRREQEPLSDPHGIANTPGASLEDAVDETSWESFPASDPPSMY